MTSWSGALSKRRVNAAGDRLVAWINEEITLGEDELHLELAVAVAWRAQHSYPIRLIMPSLRNWTAQMSTAGITPAERLKRAPLRCCSNFTDTPV
jgi:hypothetical protein